MSETSPLPPWPGTPPAHGAVVLRAFEDDDLDVVLAMASDPYIPLVTSLPPFAGEAERMAWIQRNRDRWAEGSGFSFAVADASTGVAVGHTGLWLGDLAQGRGSAGYVIAPGARGRGLAAQGLTALTSFAWTVPGLHRVQLFIEEWNEASVRTAERAGYQREGLLRSYQEIGDRRRDMVLFAAVRPT